MAGSQSIAVAIIGCGNIASRFDEDRLVEGAPLTHAGAYSDDGRFRLAACVDPDDASRAHFMTVWRTTAGFATAEEMARSIQAPEVVSICSPTARHAENMDTILALRPKVVFCEKPVTPSVAATEKIVSRCRDLGVGLAVNHTRRWDPDVVLLRDRIRTEHWGGLRAVTGIYNKGILNNGSHMIDLLHFLLGPIELVTAGTPVIDFLPDDPTIPVWLSAPRQVPVQLAAAHASDYAIFEMQFIFEHAAVSMEDGGMAWRERRAIDSSQFKGYRTLDPGVRRAGAYPRAMLRAVDNIFRNITKGDALESTGDSALLAQRVCEQILASARAQASNRPVSELNRRLS